MTQKKTAVLLYDYFSNYEFSVALSIFYQAGKPITIFGLTKDPITSEEGLKVLCDQLVEELNIEEYDSLMLTGCMNLESIINEERVYTFLKQFDLSKVTIASISSSPLLLLKAGMLQGKSYLAGALKQELLTEGFTMEQMAGMVDVEEYQKRKEEIGHFIKDGNLITSVGSCYKEWAIEFGNMLGLEFEPSWYGR